MIPLLLIGIGAGASSIIGRRRRTRRYRTPFPSAEALEDSYRDLRKFATVAELRAAVGEHVLLGTKKFRGAPPVDRVNWSALADDAEAVGKMFDLYIHYVEDERDIEMLLIGGL